MPDAGYMWNSFLVLSSWGLASSRKPTLSNFLRQCTVWASFQCTWSHSLCLEHATPLWIRETLSTGLCALLAGPQPKPHSPHGLPKAWWMGVPPICKASKQQWIRSEAKTLSVNSWAHIFADHLSFPQIFEPFRTTFVMQIKRSTLPLISKVGKLSSTLTIPFYTCSPPSVKFWHDANVANRSEQSVTRMISDPKTGFHKLIVDITELGYWTISLYAQDINSPSKTWTAVQHIVITE